jgi:hypothetical protein
MDNQKTPEEVSIETLPADPAAVVQHSPWHVIPRADWDRDERGVVNVKCPQCSDKFPLDDYTLIFDGMIVHTFDKDARETIPETATLKHSCGFDHLAILGGFAGV